MVERELEFVYSSNKVSSDKLSSLGTVSLLGHNKKEVKNIAGYVLNPKSDSCWLEFYFYLCNNQKPQTSTQLVLSRKFPCPTIDLLSTNLIDNLLPDSERLTFSLESESSSYSKNHCKSQFLFHSRF